MDGHKLRALVVDDSAYNRQTIAAMLELDPGVEVIGRASNGKEALRMVFDLQPDVITLDLEMPEMDGFAFLRVLMAKRPLPVIVVSGHSERDHVFRALELGALDFIAKPGRHIGPDLRTIQEDLLAKLRVVRRLHVVRLLQRAQHLAEQRGERTTLEVPAFDSGRYEPQKRRGPPLGALGIAASTGGPPALQQLLCALPVTLPISILVAQHMPARFTRAFAARLDKICSFHVCEATDQQDLQSGIVYIAPGAANLEVDLGPNGPRVRVRPPRGGATIVPSGDLLFKTMSDLFGPRFCALILTGMGSDGREGAELARRLGATVLAEDPNTAVMPGMPAAAIDAGVVDEVLSLEELPVAIQRFADACRPKPPGSESAA
ncbi:chemotaxis protein CheB [Nannocystis radixulma]|uniref:Protein-glutamate methylesterase/protein-glutamine glutaminase n=1 Tax=Nannocystis radixulma TaxID=2995305 RepID=A0ABT5BCH1_9BACT|nr:chemotaxis protein CheB [Nannocystis radixulma]MDC0671825.1 chemotaxis protein CheB [Nannocystis radixulma]